MTVLSICGLEGFMDKDFARGFWILVSAFHYLVSTDPWKSREARVILEELMSQTRRQAAGASTQPIFDNDRWKSIEDKWDEYSRLLKLDSRTVYPTDVSLVQAMLKSLAQPYNGFVSPGEAGVAGGAK
jgi:hypothetical protein